MSVFGARGSAAATNLMAVRASECQNHTAVARRYGSCVYLE